MQFCLVLFPLSGLIIAGEVKSVRHALFLPFQDNQRDVHSDNLKLHVYPQVNHELLFNLAHTPMS